MKKLQKAYVYFVMSNGIDVTGTSASYGVSFVPIFGSQGGVEVDG